MRKHLLLILAIVVGTFSISASAEAAGGACGGGMTFNQIFSGWKSKGVLDDVYRKAGIKPGVDAKAGSASKALLRKAFTRKKVLRGTSSARNTTCANKRFTGLTSKARQSGGTYVWVLKDDIRKNGVVKTWWAADCGNKRSGSIRVSAPKKSKPKTKKPTPTAGPMMSCPAGTTVISTNSGIACQSNSASVDNTTDVKNDCKGPNSNSSQCNTVVNNVTNITQINANCSKVIISYGDGSSAVHWQDVNGNTVTESYCSSTTVTPPPATCPTGTTGTPPNCQTPPVAKSIKILSMTDLNDIPTGKTSTNYFVEVSASEAGGSLTVDPGIGSISDCTGGSRQGSITLQVPKGITKFCFTVHAPSDPAMPTTMTVKATAVLGSASDTKDDALAITYPVRP